MMRTGVVVALVLLCACDKGSGGKPAKDEPPPPESPQAADPDELIEGVMRASRAADPGATIVQVAAKACGAGCPCLEPTAGARACSVDALGPAAAGVPVGLAWAGKYLSDQAAQMASSDRDRLVGELAALDLRIAPTAPGITLPAGQRLAASTSWAHVVIARDGALSVGGAARVRLTSAGAVFEAAVAPRSVGVGEANAALAALAPPDEKSAAAEPEATGTSMALEEGKMGRRDSAQAEAPSPERPDPATGPYVDPCDGHQGFGAGVGGLEPSNGGIGVGTIGIAKGNGYAVGPGGNHDRTPRFSVLAVRGAPGRRPLILADAGTASTRVLEVLVNLSAEHGAALAVQSGSQIGAIELAICSGASDKGVIVKLEGGSDPKVVRAAFEGRAQGSTTGVTLLVSDSATHGDLVGALDALLDAGAEMVQLQSAATSATGRIRDEPKVRIGAPTAVGDLDKAIIRRYIKRNLQKIEHCYEKQLLTKPDLAGTVSTQFVIAPDGKVAESTATGVDEAVASCVAAVIESIEFPKPKGGGAVQVSYPFTFAPTGG